MNNACSDQDLKLIYRNKGGTVIVSLPDGRYYYGNGKTFGGFGVAPNQFLRFNPYMEWVEEQNLEVPEAVRKWINENA